MTHYPLALGHCVDMGMNTKIIHQIMSKGSRRYKTRRFDLSFPKMVTITKTFVTSSDGAKIYAEAVGDPGKPALILVPGYTLSTVVFDKQFHDPLLQKELFMIRYDMRGHGQSAMPETEAEHISKLYADDLVAVCEAFKVVKPVFAGWSLGGTIVTDICAHLGADFISAAILMAGVPYTGAIVGRIVPSPVFDIVAGIQQTSDVTLYKKQTIAFVNSVFLDPSSVPFDVRLSWAGSGLCQPPIVSKLVLERKQEEIAFHEAGRKGLKLLCMHGVHDAQRVSGMAVVEELRGHFKDIQVVELEDAGHAFFYEKSEETNAVLLNFTRKACSA
ncbi:Alpha/Beta hydrolase protein [Mycena floridula]|nr:Alpha/Beta hydrolase protein [Mycena floridula]